MPAPDPEAEAEAEARRKRIAAMFEGKPIADPQIVPGGYPVELFDRAEQGDDAAFDAIGDFLRRGAVELMRRGRGGMSCTAYVFCRRDPVGSAAVDPLYTTSITSSEAHDDWRAKNCLTMLVHGIARIGQARAVAFMMEAWRVKTMDATRPAGSLEFVPGREEIVLVTLETKSAARVWSGVVTRYGGRGFSIAPLEGSPADTKHRGRFFGVMQPGYDPDVAATELDPS